MELGWRNLLKNIKWNSERKREKQAKHNSNLSFLTSTNCGRSRGARHADDPEAMWASSLSEALLAA